uniref:Uncharacterized protein n=1 Tax=Rhizophora mucronata TaxID=61149 RepID=A0A2P2N905_RHIMU
MQWIKLYGPFCFLSATIYLMFQVSYFLLID